MAGYNVSGSDALKLRIEKHEEDSGGYPFEIPEVYLHGEGVYDYKFPIFDYENDSVILVRNKHILEYRLSWYREMLLKNSNGETEWVAGNMIENEDYETTEFLGDIRVVNRCTIIEYDVEKREKRIGSVVLGKSVPMTMDDCYRLTDIVDKEMLGNCYEIKDTEDFKGFCF